MQSSPLNGVFDFLIMALGLGTQNYQSQQIIEIPAIILPPQYQAPPDLPRFPLPPTNPGYNDRPINPFFPPPAQPIDPNDRNQNGIPDDIDALLGGL